VLRPLGDREKRKRPRSGGARPPAGRGRRGSHYAPGQRRPDRARARTVPALHGDPRRGADRHPRAVRHPCRAPAEADRGRRQLEDWEATREYDRTGIDGQTTQVLEVTLPLVTVPLNPGKNLTVVCEVVAMNHLL